MEHKAEEHKIDVRLSVMRLASFVVLACTVCLIYWSSASKHQDVPPLVYALLVVLFFLANIALGLRAQRDRTAISKRAAERQAVESESDLLRRVVAGLAATSNSLYWIARGDGTVDLFGAWFDQVGVEGPLLPVVDFADLVDAEPSRQSFMDAMQHRASWSRIISRTVDAEEITLQSTASPSFGHDGRFLGLVGSTVNITGSLANQAQADQTRAELDARTSNLLELCRRVSMPALDIQARVASLRASATAGDLEEVVRLIDQVDLDAAQLSGLVEGSMELVEARVEPSLAELHPFHLEAIIDIALQDARRLTGAEGNLTMSLDPLATRAVYGSASALRRVLTVLVTNAIQYGGEGGGRTPGAIVVASGPTCMVEVVAEGVALSPTELSRLVSLFYRGSASRGTIGRGLGLAWHASLRQGQA